MRVFELARTLDLQSRKLIEELKKLKIPVSTASSAIGDADVSRIMEHFQQRQGGGAGKKAAAPARKGRAAPPAKAEDGERRLSSALDQARRRVEQLRARKGQSAAETARQGLSDKAAQERARREELRRKQAKLLIAQAKGEPISAELRQELEPLLKSSATGVLEPPAQTAPAEGAGRGETPERKRRRKKAGRGKPQEDEMLVLRDIQVMRMDKTEVRGRRKPDERGKKKKSRFKPSKLITADDVGIKEHPRGAVIGRGAGRRGEGRELVGPPRRLAVSRTPLEPKIVRIEGDLTLGQFADKINVPVSELMKTILVMGESITINDYLTPELCELLAQEYQVALELIPDTDESDIRDYLIANDPAAGRPRPPIVTIMGHVDHGKTSLMDAVRQSDVVGAEFGGITQKIGAYYVDTGHGAIAFIDTPGHEAFTAMRARGVQVTDVVVLVVAADDGVMPQTVEAINHSNAADVPIIVAINKVDLPNANPQKVKQELLSHNLVSEDFGGQTIFVEVSALTKQGVDKLLEMILLQTEILELKANPEQQAEGVIIESHIDQNRGAVATVLIRKGTLKTGDIFVAGDVHGRVRRMRDEHDRMLEQAGPSRPVELIGLSGCPEAGEYFLALKDERTAREIAEKRAVRRRTRNLKTTRHVSLDNISEFIQEGKVKELNLIIKADLQGSIEAIRQSLDKLPSSKVKVRYIHAGVGAITESDVNLAITTESVVVGFNVRPESNAKLLAESQGVDVRLYRIIYKLLEEIEKALLGMLEPVYSENFRGRANVLQVFKMSKIGNVAGCFVEEGEILRSGRIRLTRDNVVIHEGKIRGLRRIKDDVTRVQSGLECGIQIENFQDIKAGDQIECFELEEIKQQL